jgi:hypothetical protein
MTLEAYAGQIGQNYQTVAGWKHAAEVAAVIGANNWKDLTRYTQHLSLIHARPEGEWEHAAEVAVIAGNNWKELLPRLHPLPARDGRT